MVSKMIATDIPAVVQTLIIDHIDSLEQLEILLLLGGPAAGRWTEASLRTKLGLTPARTVEALSALRAKGFLVEHQPGSQWEYAPHTSALDDAVVQLGRIYATQRLDIVTLMCSIAVNRLRNDALRAFAGSFESPKVAG